MESVVRAAVRRTAPPAGDVSELLGPDELDRWRALHRQTDRDDFYAVRLLARELLTGLAGEDTWTFKQSCETCGGPHGLPRVSGHPDLHVSWAHAQGVVAAAVSNARVGIDVERLAGVAPFDDDPSPERHRWLRWTRMEALVKRGDADLDTALHWPLAGEAQASSRPIRAWLPDHPIRGVLTDVVDTDGAWVASLASDSAPRSFAI